MISIIICSKNIHLDEALEKNIQATIGTDYEIIHIDNSQRAYNIFQAYNLGITRAKGDNLCFMHEDIIFHSDNWGKIVEFYLAQPLVGALGVAGGYAVTEDLDWRFHNLNDMFLCQDYTSVEAEPQRYCMYRPTSEPHAPLRPVVLLDGVWMCMRRELFNTICFDENNFHDFHLYDSDICMQINQTGLGIFVTHDILLEHLSEGSFSQSFVDSYNVFVEKWHKHLPLFCGRYIDEKELEQSLRQGHQLLEKRLKEDQHAAELRKLLQMKQQGLPCRDFTQEELAFLDESAYRFRRFCIKDKRIPLDKVREVVKSYCALPYARRKTALKLKYFWYRLVKGIFSH